MRKFENIVQSETAPQTNSLWLKDGKLLYFNNGSWKELTNDNSNNNSDSEDNRQILYGNIYNTSFLTTGLTSNITLYDFNNSRHFIAGKTYKVTINDSVYYFRALYSKNINEANLEQIVTENIVPTTIDITYDTGIVNIMNASSDMFNNEINTLTIEGSYVYVGKGEIKYNTILETSKSTDLSIYDDLYTASTTVDHISGVNNNEQYILIINSIQIPVTCNIQNIGISRRISFVENDNTEPITCIVSSRTLGSGISITINIPISNPNFKEGMEISNIKIIDKNPYEVFPFSNFKFRVLSEEEYADLPRDQQNNDLFYFTYQSNSTEEEGGVLPPLG